MRNRIVLLNPGARERASGIISIRYNGLEAEGWLPCGGLCSVPFCLYFDGRRTEVIGN